MLDPLNLKLMLKYVYRDSGFLIDGLNKRSLEKFKTRFEKILDIYLCKDFSKVNSNYDKCVILLSFIQEYLICLKNSYQDFYCGDILEFKDKEISELLDKIQEFECKKNLDDNKDKNVKNNN